MILSDLPLTDDEIIDIAVSQLGMSPLEASMMLAIERGEIYGDLVAIDKNGNEVDPYTPSEVDIIPL